tara:strand:+ start:1569 stop:2495 length:927 start_codon:yes stop_codon:yes gene_type:complete
MAEAIQVDSMSHKRNLSRVQRDEEELKELLKQAGVTTDETEEEAVEAEPNSSEPSEPSIQAESATKQEEEPKAEAQEEDLSAEEKNFKKRYGDLRRHSQEKEKEFQAQLDTLKAQLDSATKNELVLPKSEDEVEAWAKKYPDVAGIVEAIADKKASERSSELDGRLKEIEALRTTAKREKAEAELISMHPDFEEIRADDAFHSWAEKQPKVVQDALYENSEDAKSVARVIDLYKSDIGIKTSKSSTSDKAAASSVKAKGRATPDTDDSSKYLSESQVEKMSMKEYEKRMDEIFDAQRNGKFIYDISKK